MSSSKTGTCSDPEPGKWPSPPKENEAIFSLRILLDKVYEAYKTSLSLPQEGVEELALIILSLGSTSLLNALTV